MLTEHFPAQRAPQEQIDGEAYDLRASKMLAELVTSLRAGSTVVTVEQAPALTGLIQVAQ
jgi:hypothetical protein